MDIRVQDYRDIDDGPFDAISSIGMSEHVGREQLDRYVSKLHGLLRPGGRMLNHAISWNAGPTEDDPDSFIPRYVFPDGQMLSLSEVMTALEGGGFEVLDVEALRRHYALTLRAWVKNLEENWTRPCGSQRTAAPASGGCTWRPVHSASKAASPA